MSILVKQPEVKLSVIRFKNGDSLTGAILRKKEGAYIVRTDLGELTISEEKIEKIDEKA